MRFIYLIILFFAINIVGLSQSLPSIPFESNDNYTATLEEIDQFYTDLANFSPMVNYYSIGQSDIGRDLHVAILSNDQISLDNPPRDKPILLINNAIHPGEPCGVDACMMMARDIVSKPSIQQLLDSVVLVIIPAYNLGGVLNRGSFSRANQDGPLEYGFRGNAKNLDLNRDFVKSDSKNAQCFHRFFSLWKPQVFVDTHTTNGADYPYTMTLISTQRNQLGGPMSSFMREKMIPKLFDKMEQANWEMSPYVFSTKDHLKQIVDFNDSPRFSTGYASTMHSMGFVTEAHMLKPYKDRVWSTYHFLKSLLQFSYENSLKLNALRDKQDKYYREKSKMTVKWNLDQENCDTIIFSAHPREKKPSKWSGGLRTFYNRDSIFLNPVPYCTEYTPVVEVDIPDFYIMPSAYSRLIKKLEDNGVRFERLERDSVFELELYRIKQFETRENPYESHYEHSGVEVSKLIALKRYYKGDIVIPTDQFARKYIVSALEPESVDSWFIWNFFDGILMQKEHYSSYVFEDTVAELLESNPELRKKLDEEKEKDPEFAKSPGRQMKFIYYNSPYYEGSHNLYPVGRIYK